MAANVSSTIASMKTTTAINDAQKKEKAGNNADSNMFLTLMLKQMEYQDPTSPTSNEQWLAQLAQYSSLEEMQNLNKNFSNVSAGLDQLNQNMLANSSISQTLSLVGKEVTIIDPEDKEKRITGKVTEATFKDGTGYIKIDGKEYPIGYVESVKEIQA